MSLPGRVFAGRWVCPGLEIQAPARFWSGEPLGGWAGAWVCPWATELQAYTQTPAALPRVRARRLGPGLSIHTTVSGQEGEGRFHLESPTNGARRAACLSRCLLPPWVTYFSFVYKLAFPFNFYLFLVAFKTVPEDNGLFVNHRLVGFWRGKLGGENVMFCGLFVVQKEVLRCRKLHTTQTFKWRQMFCLYC